MAKVNYGDAWTKVAVGESKTTKKDEKEKEKKKEDSKKDKDESVCDCFHLPDAKGLIAFYFLLPDRAGMKASAVNEMTNNLLAKITSVAQIIVLRELYRTSYTGDELQSLSDGRLNLKTHKTSHLNDAERDWLQTQVGGPAHFTMMAGGLGARLLNHCEMYGISGFAITAITESHYVSAESMQAYKVVFERLGLNSGVFDCSKISEKSKFRELLKETNSRANTIFS